MATVQSLRDQMSAAIADGDHDRALSLAQQIRRFYPDDFETAQLLGQLFLEKQQYLHAREAFGEVLEVDPESVLARSALAIIAEEEGDLDGALEQFQRAFSINPSNRELEREIQRLRSLGGRAPSSTAEFPEYSLARRLMLEREHADAAQLFEVALQTSPTEESALGMAEALWLLGRRGEAEQAARSILSDHPNCLKALAIAAGATLLRCDGEARTLLARAEALNPGSPVARALFRDASLEFPADMEAEAEIPAEALFEDETVEPELSPPEEEQPQIEADSPEGSGVEDAELGTGEALEPVDEVDGSAWLSRRLAAVMAKPSLEGSDGASMDDRPPEKGSPEASVEGQEERQKIDLVFSPEDQRPTMSGGVSSRGGPTVGRAGDAALHLSFALSFNAKGQPELALDECRTALRLDPTTAEAVAGVAESVADAYPFNVRARWLVGDALVVAGRLQRAMEQYLTVLERK